MRSPVHLAAILAAALCAAASARAHTVRYGRSGDVRSFASVESAIAAACSLRRIHAADGLHPCVS